MMSLSQFETQLRGAIASVVPRLEIGLDRVGSLVLPMTAEYPGHNQPGWAPLAASTLRDKEKQGYPVPSPLKRTGDMAASYAKEMVPSELAVVIGSPEKIALWQEMGTVHIPPRLVSGLAMRNALPYAADVFGHIAVGLLMGRASE